MHTTGERQKMGLTGEGQKTYGVSLDRKGVRRIDMGPGPLGTRVRCTVPLSGEIDEHWRVSFRRVQLEDTGFFRFRLELASPTVTFVATTGAEIESELKKLGFLLDAVNALASRG